MQIRKEISLAVLIGLIIATIIIGGIYRAKTAISKSQKNRPSASPTASTTSANSTVKDGNIPLTIISPIDNTVTKEPNVSLSGVTDQGTYIAILAEKNEYLLVPNDLGKFNQDIALIKGANSIKVTVYTNQGASVSKELSIVYTAAEI